MSSDLLEDVFGGDVDALEATKDLDQDVSAPECREYGMDTSNWLWVSLLLVPDVARFPVPEEFTQDKQAVDISEAYRMTAAEVKVLVTPTLPDGQLEVLHAAELDRPKPRTVALKAIEAERNRRGAGYCNWVQQHSTVVTRCRIAGMAMARGMGDVQVFACEWSESEQEEVDGREIGMLEEFWRQDRSHLAAWDRATTETVLRIRSIYHNCDGRTHNSFFAHAPDFREIGSTAVTELAGALGIVEAARLPNACEVFEAFYGGDRTGLEAFCEDQLIVERDVILASYSC